MNGRGFLDVAKELCRRSTEGHWRTAAGRAYYGLLWEAWTGLERWGLSVPRHQSVHYLVRTQLIYAADADLHEVGKMLDRLADLRNKADYWRTGTNRFASSQWANAATKDAEAGMDRLTQVEGDPTRLAAAIADIRARWP